jgi:hypothetical protein
MMDLDESDLSDPRPGESAAAFESRLRMLRRVSPVVEQLTERGFTVVVESDRRGGHPDLLESDLVVEYGDVRLRVLLCPNERSPLRGSASLDRLAHYFLDVPDTDAVAVVADDDGLTTSVLDVYDANDPAHPSAPARSLAAAVATYFTENVFAVELPDFRAVVTLPSEAELRERLERAMRSNFDRVKSGRVRIPEKIAALDTLGPDDARRLIAGATSVLSGETPTINELLGRDEGEES